MILGYTKKTETAREAVYEVRTVVCPLAMSPKTLAETVSHALDRLADGVNRIDRVEITRATGLVVTIHKPKERA